MPLLVEQNLQECAFGVALDRDEVAAVVDRLRPRLDRRVAARHRMVPDRHDHEVWSGCDVLLRRPFDLADYGDRLALGEQNLVIGHPAGKQ